MHINCTVVVNENIIIFGRILHMDEDKIIVECELEHKILEHDGAKLYVYHPIKGELVYRVDIEQIFKDSLLLINYKLIEAHQKRTETRVDVAIPIEVRKLEFYGKTLELEKYISMKITNLSANGMKLDSHLSIPDKVNLKIEIPIDGEIIETIVQIVRKLETENGFSYGCKIVRVLNCSLDKIRYFVYQTQIKLSAASKQRIS